MEVRLLPPEPTRLPAGPPVGTKGMPSTRDSPLATKKAPRSLAVVVMAAGKGKRLRSKLPKVLMPVCGRPALWHVLRAARRLRPERLVVVVHHGREDVEAAVRSWGGRPEPVFVDQGDPQGTGHAVMTAERAVGRASEVVVVPGDSPLITGEMLRDLLRTHRRRGAVATVQTTELPDARGYGRVIRDGTSLVRIAEEKDATPTERRIREVCTSVYAFDRAALFGALPLVGTDNVQREYYLPDVLSILVQKGESVAVERADFGGALDINTHASLARASGAMRARINADHMANGVTILDPGQTYIDVTVRLGAETVLYPLTFLEGATKVAAGCTIGPSVRLVDTSVGEGSEVQFAVVREARIGAGASVGPFASIRPGTVLGDGAKVGTFVEVKASRVGKGSKVPHLSYVGDATIGEGTNVGAATVTVNYDGYEKHRTVVGDDVRIGSDTMLVAPIRIGNGAVTGAGSVLTRDVPPGALAVERSEQKIVKGYRKRKDAKKAADRAGGKATHEGGA